MNNILNNPSILHNDNNPKITNVLKDIYEIKQSKYSDESVSFYEEVLEKSNGLMTRENTIGLSVTSILDGSKQFILNKYMSKNSQLSKPSRTDYEDNIDAIFGDYFHDLFLDKFQKQSPKSKIEKRLGKVFEKTYKGKSIYFLLNGKFDLFLTQCVHDIKTTKVYALNKPENHILQLSLYRYLLRSYKIKDVNDYGGIIYIFKDWGKKMIKIAQDYPPNKVYLKYYKLFNDEYCEQYISKIIDDILKCDVIPELLSKPDNNIDSFKLSMDILNKKVQKIPCTDDQCWKSSTIKIYTKDADPSNSKSKKNMSNINEYYSDTISKKFPLSKHDIYSVNNGANKCKHYCDVRDYCDQGNKNVSTTHTLINELFTI